MAFLSMTMPSAALAPAAVSHRRCLAVVAPARPSCVSAIAASQRKPFESSHGISLLRSKAAAQRSTARQQVKSSACRGLCIPMQTSKPTAYKVGPAGVRKSWCSRRDNGQRGSHTQVSLVAKPTRTQHCTEAGGNDTAYLQTSWLDQLLGPACVVDSLCNYPVLCCIIIHAGKFLLWQALLWQTVTCDHRGQVPLSEQACVGAYNVTQIQLIW